jgi:hypothetical protein
MDRPYGETDRPYGETKLRQEDVLAYQRFCRRCWDGISAVLQGFLKSMGASEVHDRGYCSTFLAGGAERV